MDHSQTEVTLIMAATRSMGIGWQGQLPWRTQLRNENQYFHRVTTRARNAALNAVIMGRKTWDAARTRPLKGRINVIITRNARRVREDMKARQISGERVHIVNSFDEGIATLHRLYSDGIEEVTNCARCGSGGVRLGRIFVIGGGELCTTVLSSSRVVRVLLTLINADYNCDAFLFPVFDETGAAGWRRQNAEELDHWVGEAVPRGCQSEDGVTYQFMMFQREHSEMKSQS